MRDDTQICGYKAGVHLLSTHERSGSYRAMFRLDGFREVALEESWAISSATVTSVATWGMCWPPDLYKTPDVSFRDVLLCARCFMLSLAVLPP